MQSPRKMTNTTQTISFSEGDGVSSSEVYATDVVVTTNAGNHNHGSSKFKLRSLVDYNWEPKFYLGQLLAVHLSGKYLAYCIKAPNPNNPGTWNGMVRVVYHSEPGVDRRTLIKGMKGEVQDLGFAHIHNQVVLSCIDEMGNFYVYEIEATDTGLRCTCVAEVCEDTGAGGSAHRVVWCPYIPDEDDDDDDVARLLLTTHANVARMWNLRSVGVACAAAGGATGAGALLAAGAGRAAGAHAAPLTAAAFSPDGTALATAARDGYVMFAQVYMNNESSPRCLHKWQPHDGKPLSCLFFLDNHKNYNSEEQFWKFAVTGAENNTSLKIWTCKSWACLQTITFSPTINTSGMKAMLDSSASYLLLSDFDNRSLYVLNMTRDTDDTEAYCKSISEFLLPYPVLSFCIVDAEEQQVRPQSSCGDPYNRNGDGDVEVADSPDHFLHDDASEHGSPLEPTRRVRVRLYIVQPKGLQEGTLLYTPPTTLPAGTHDMGELTQEDGDDNVEPSTMPSSILQQQTQQLKNLLMRSQTQPGSLMVQRAESPPLPPLNLMTPDAFSSPGKHEDDDPPLSATPDLGTKSRLSITAVAEEVSPATDAKQVSGGSSPSLEVQQIMGHGDQPFFPELEEAASAPVTGASPAADKSSGAAPEPLFPPPAFAPPESSGSAGDTSWPTISIAHIAEANQRKASSDKSSNQSLNASLNSSLSAAPLNPSPASAPPPAPVLPAPERPPNDYISKTRLDALEAKLDNLTELMGGQARELRTLRGELREARPPPELLRRMEQLLLEHSTRSAAQLDQALHSGWERVARLGEAAARAAGAAAGGGAARALEPLAAALQHELVAKLSATDDLLRDNIHKLANSKTVMEQLSNSIAASLADMVRASFRDALFESVVPVMEKAHAQMFKQINHTFQSGTREFAAHTESAARAAVERGGAAAVASLRAALDAHADALAAATRAPLTPHAFAAQLQEVAHGVLEKEVAWWREQARAAAQLSRSHSPATSASTPAHDRQMQANQIHAMLGRGDVNGAFQTALSAADLSLVVAACRGVEPARVFGPPCRLRQPVLLSLVQQLAADMAKDTALKHRYLEEAIINLDTSNPVTREHLPVVIRELQAQIVSFLNANPGCALVKQFKMLLMATESLVKAV